MELVLAVEDPTADDIRALVGRHLAHAVAVTPPGYVHALVVDDLLGPDVTLYGARREGELVGIGALRHLSDAHAEIKSMHTEEAERGRGIGQAVLVHLLSVAATRGYERVSLETGTMAAFAPARTLYQRAGFAVCTPFGDHTHNPQSV